MNILLGPLYSLFSPSFYRWTVRSSLGNGFLYLGYLSCLASLVLTLVFHVWALPRADEFMAWLKGNFPQIRFTANGIQTNLPQPVHLKHPQWGSLLSLDTRIEGMPTDPNLSQTSIYVTKTKMVIRRPDRNEYRVFDLVPSPAEKKNFKEVTVNGELLESVYRSVAVFAYPIVFLFGLVFFIFWKSLAGFFYSLIGLLLNLFRKQKLPYERILNCAFFALTPVCALQALEAALRRPLFINFWTAALITAVYLGIGILGKQGEDIGYT